MPSDCPVMAHSVPLVSGRLSRYSERSSTDVRGATRTTSSHPPSARLLIVVAAVDRLIDQFDAARDTLDETFRARARLSAFFAGQVFKEISR